MKIYHVEFYDRNNLLDHNDSYASMDEAVADAAGRYIVVTGVEEVEDDA